MHSIRDITGSALLGVLVLGCMPHALRHGASDGGEPAPAIEGPDPDGKMMRLADFRGKVVLVSFWHGN